MPVSSQPHPSFSIDLLLNRICEMLKAFDKYLRSPRGVAIWFGLVPLVCVYLRHIIRKHQIEDKDKEVRSQDPEKVTSSNQQPALRKVTLLYGTTTGTSRALANQFAERLNGIDGVEAEVYDMASYNTDLMKDEDLLLLLCSTWSNGNLPENCHHFLLELEDLVHDFRISKDLLAKVQFAVFGLGGELYGEHFCTAAHSVHAALEGLGGRSLFPPVCGDDQTDLEQKFDNWCIRLESAVVTSVDARAVAKKQSEKRKANKGPKSYQSPAIQYVTDDTDKTSKGKLRKVKGSVREGKRAAYKSAKEQGLVPDHPNRRHNKSSSTSSVTTEGSDERVGQRRVSADTGAGAGAGASREEVEAEEEDLINDTFCRNSDDEEEGGAEESKRAGGDMTDMEDLGKVVVAAKTVDPSATSEGREMVTKLQRKSLVKEGYKIIGTHSAVKICRWTKNQMRGRGGCYKHSFYGIVSYQCMEATPSLACANKCVFCWRHHKNPVGTSWRWKTDEPGMIVEEAVSEHVKMVNQMKGVPGVLPERFLEAKTVKHCALSLVGEPIMYPRINEMVRHLHDRGISSFLVGNGQFPEEIKNMEPVTQLYVSVDAATSESMKAVDRPLHKDFWERFQATLAFMKEKQQRTVYRMTLVKSWNMDEVNEYAELIEQGQPDFIEIKAVTYCGKSDASSLTMENVPWHHEVCKYAEAIVSKMKSKNSKIVYGLASEHQHSCCILIAREDKFKVNGQWHTWIDYPKFHELIGEYYASGGTKSFVSTEYMAATPDWALYQSSERGFDPQENRWKRGKNGDLVEIDYKSSESGCG